MTYEQADILLYFLTNMKTVSSAKMYERTQDAVIRYTGDREVIIEEMKRFSSEKTEVPFRKFRQGVKRCLSGKVNQ